MSRLQSTLASMQRTSSRWSWSHWLLLTGSIAFIAIVLAYLDVFQQQVQFSQLRIVTPNHQSITPYYKVHGEALLHEQKVLVTHVAGVIEQIYISPGSQVQADEPLIRFTNPELLDELEQLKLDKQVQTTETQLQQERLLLQVERQQSHVDLAEVTLAMEASRLASETALHEKHILSDLDFNQSTLRYQQAEVELKKQQQELRMAEKELTMSKRTFENATLKIDRQLELVQRKVDHLTLKAPSDLTILELEPHVSLGAAFQASSPLIRYFQPYDLAIRVRVPPALLPRLTIGQDAWIQVGHERLPAQILRIGSRVESGALPVWLTTKQPLTQYFTEGQDVEAGLMLAQVQHASSMTTPPWYRGPGLYDVYCVQQHYLQPCQIELGYSDHERVELLNDVPPGTLYEVSHARHWLGTNVIAVQP